MRLVDAGTCRFCVWCRCCHFFVLLCRSAFTH